MLKIITYLKTGRRTQRDITLHMGWKVSKWNKTTRRHIQSLEECNVPICSIPMEVEGNVVLVFWIDRHWTF